MNGPLVVDAARPAFETQALEAPRGRDAGGGPRPGQAHSWQRAFEHAQRDGFDRWFSAVPEHAAGAAATGKTAPASLSRPVRGPTPFPAPGVARPRGEADPASVSVHRSYGARSGVCATQAWDERVRPCTEAHRCTQALAAALSHILSMPMAASTSFNPSLAPSRAGRGSGVDVDAVARASMHERTAGTGAHARPDEESEPLRLHADWSTAGVRLWLGANPSLSWPLEPMLAALRRVLQAQGARLLEVVCNGRVVWTPEATETSSSFISTHPVREFP